MSVKQRVWSTKLVEETREAILNGFLPPKKDSPYYENKIGLRKENVIFEMTNDEIDEYIKCYNDVMYFAENYCFVKSEDGKHKIIKLRPYQKDILIMYKENRFSILMAARQSGKTVSSAIYILHYLLFNNQKNVLITANKWDTNYDIVAKIKEIYSYLPYFLQKGVVIWNQKNFSFDNKSKIRTDIVSKAAGVGANIDMWYGDEFAIPDNKILEKFYMSVYPTISSMDNSKIILTSTPRGLNLFHKLLIDAERPVGDPQKNPFTAMRVYWYSVPSRFCTYVRLDQSKLHELHFTKEEILEYCVEKYGTKFETEKGISGCELVYDSGLGKSVIYIYNDEFVTEEVVIGDSYKDVPFYTLGEITTWKKEAIKGIGGEDAFNQEFGLRFVTANRSLLDEKLVDDLQKGIKPFIKYEIDLFNQKLRFNWSDLKFIQDLEIFNPNNRKNYQIILSLDISEGLGNDYTVINIFKISPKTESQIEPYIHSFKSVSDFFMLEQIGIYRSNLLTVNQLADILYLISFEFFNPDNVKIVLELNYGGPELLAFLPHVFDGRNNYGSSIFFKYKHRIDADDEKIGLKVTAGKNMMVKDYQDAMQRRDIVIYNEDNVRELTTFIKHETNAGNIQYKSDSSNDDTVMTVVNMATIFKKAYYHSMVDLVFRSCDKTFQDMVNTHLKNMDYNTGTDYNTFTNVTRRLKNLNKINGGIFGV